MGRKRRLPRKARKISKKDMLYERLRKMPKDRLAEILYEIEEAPQDRETMRLFKRWPKDVLINEILSHYPLPRRVERMIK